MEQTEFMPDCSGAIGLARFLVCAGMLLALAGAAAQPPRTAHIEVPVGGETFSPDSDSQTTFNFGSTGLIFTGASPILLHVELGGSRATSIPLPAALSQGSDVKLYSGGAVVIAGPVDGDVSMIAIVDPGGARVRDSFLCYSPSISPDGRFIAFVKFFPAHAMDSATDHYMLYDLAKSPAENRPAGIKLDPACVGKPVFPPGIGNSAGDNVDDPEESVNSMSSDEFFWREDSSGYVFLDRKAETYTLVSVGVTKGNPSVISHYVPASDICPAGVWPCYEQLTAVSFPSSAQTHMKVVVRGVLGTPAKQTTLVLSAATLTVVPDYR